MTEQRNEEACISYQQIIDEKIYTQKHYLEKIEKVLSKNFKVQKENKKYPINSSCKQRYKNYQTEMVVEW